MGDAHGHGAGGSRYRKPKKKPKPRPDRVRNVKDFFRGATSKPEKDRSSSRTVVIRKKNSRSRDNDDNRRRSGVSTSGRSGGHSSHRPSVGRSNKRRNNRNDNRGKGRSNSNGGGRGNGGGKGRSKGNGGKGDNRYRNQAEKYVRNDIKYAIQQLENEKEARKKALEYQQNQINARYERAVGDLQHVFGEANEQNQIQTKAILDRLTQGRSEANQTFDELGITQQNNTDENKAALMAELERLGIQTGANLEQYSADAAFMNNLTETNQTNAIANLNAMSTGAANIGNLISQTANSSLASNIGKQGNLRDQSLADAQQQYRGDLDDIMNQMRLERMSKGNRVWELFRELEDQGYNRWFNEREANRANRLGWSNFNLSASQANADNMFRHASLLQEQRQQAAMLRAQQAQAQAFQNGIDPRLQGILGF